VVHAPTVMHPVHALPTRRSSDLDEPSRSSDVPAGCCAKAGAATSVDSAMIRMDFFIREVLGGCLVDACNVAVLLGRRTRSGSSRSEEHTSELQSRANIVCCLLLE